MQGSIRIRMMMLMAAFVVVCGWSAISNAAPPAPPSGITVKDAPNDAGTGLIVEWQLSPDDRKDADPRVVVRYEIDRLARPLKPENETPIKESKFAKVGEVNFQLAKYLDQNANRQHEYLYRVRAVSVDGESSTAVESTVAVQPELQYFDMRRAWYLVLLVVVGGAVVYFIQVVKSGKDLKIRKIAGLEAVEEAVGRATEMGRSCLFIPGILDINDIQTVAGITVMSRVAGLVAEYNASLEIPTCRSLVMTTSRETVAAAYLSAGRPDAYREDDIYYLTDEQFGYVAAVTGNMVRKKPAACFYMGAFFAESLLLAETGNAIGAIQVAGTAMPSQLPFFVAACDYTLIGEEFFAASAYLSHEPHQLGSLKGQDIGKFIGGILIIAGCLLATVVAVMTDPPSGLESLVTFIRENILGEKGFMP